MSQVMYQWRSRLWWIVPVLALGVLLGIELGWGRQVHHLPEPGPAPEARPVTAALLPEYKIQGGLASRAETVNRTLFNPTRRPAPIVVADTGRQQMPHGQFILTGTSLAGERTVAFLKEVAGGKSRTVRQGEQINGILVAEVKPDRVRLTLGGDSEELVLKVGVGPRTTGVPTSPVPVTSPVQASPATPFGPVSPGQVGAPGAPQSANPLTEQRRRAGQAAGVPEAAPAPTPAPAGSAPTAGPGAPASADPAWNEVFERMRQRSNSN